MSHFKVFLTFYTIYDYRHGHRSCIESHHPYFIYYFLSTSKTSCTSFMHFIFLPNIILFHGRHRGLPLQLRIKVRDSEGHNYTTLFLTSLGSLPDKLLPDLKFSLIFWIYLSISSSFSNNFFSSSEVSIILSIPPL